MHIYFGKQVHQSKTHNYVTFKCLKTYSIKVSFLLSFNISLKKNPSKNSFLKHVLNTTFHEYLKCDNFFSPTTAI